MLEKTLESPLDCKETKPINPKGKQLWMFIRRTDAEAKAPILWPPDVKSQLIGKDPDTRKDWGQEDKGVTENKMVGWYHWLNKHEFEQTLEDSEGQGSLACCSPWSHKVSDITERLNNSKDTLETLVYVCNWICYKCFLYKTPNWVHIICPSLGERIDNREYFQAIEQYTAVKTNNSFM